MPFSSHHGKLWIKIYCDALGTDWKRLLDIGVGHGTYRRLLGAPGQHWTGIEVWEPYVAAFGLRDLYDDLVLADVRAVDFAAMGPFDAAFLGDVLEHMTKEEALRLLEAVAMRSRYLFVSLPIIYSAQEAWRGNPFEKHIKPDWSHQEALSSLPYLGAACEHDEIGVYALARTASDRALLGRMIPLVAEMMREWGNSELGA